MKVRLSTKLTLSFVILIIIATIGAMKVAQTRAINCNAKALPAIHQNK